MLLLFSLNYTYTNSWVLQRMAHTLYNFHFRPSLGAPGGFFSPYASILNENTNDRYLNPIGELNPKDQFDRWENLLSLSITLQSLVEPIKNKPKKLSE